MFPRITDVRHVHDYILELTFADGHAAQLDFEELVGRGGVFAVLEDIVLFRQVQVDEEAGTLVWPNGVDFCADVLYSEAMNSPLPIQMLA